MLGILLFWLFINFICLMLGKEGGNGLDEYLYAKDNFFPFTDLKLLYAYDISEFVVYGVSPIIVFTIIKLRNHENN
jgi:hypothetical protein